ncbi:MAG TPA: hypothetical protein VII73_05220 [Caulobacteraceae bacterium]
MKAFARDFSMTAAVSASLWLGALVAAGPAVSAQSCAGPAPTLSTLPPDLLAAAARVNTYPTFCSIPARPTDVRAAGAFRSAVVDTRVAGADLVAEDGDSSFSLNGTDDFAAAARGEAVAPPPMTTPEDAGTDAFINEMRSRATPPPRPR